MGPDGFEGESGNYRQLLVRGSTHMPYAEPAYGTPVYLRPMKQKRATVSA